MPASPGGGQPPTVHMPDGDPSEMAHEIPVPEADMEVEEHQTPFAPSSALAFGKVDVDMDTDVDMPPASPDKDPSSPSDVTMPSPRSTPAGRDGDLPGHLPQRIASPAASAASISTRTPTSASSAPPSFTCRWLLAPRPAPPALSPA